MPRIHYHVRRNAELEIVRALWQHGVSIGDFSLYAKMSTENQHRTWDLAIRKFVSAWEHGLRATLIALGLLLFCTGIRSTGAREAIMGDWLVETKAGTDYVHLTVRRGETGGRIHSMSAFDIRQEALDGLSQALTQSDGSPVQFQLSRDAGTLNFEGSFKKGKGVGRFIFIHNRNLTSQMASLNYGNLSDEQLYSMTLLDVGPAFIRELAALGYDHVSLDQLMAMRTHGAGPKFINELKAEGYDYVPVNDLVAMRIHGVSLKYIKEVKAVGYDHVAIDQLVAMRIHGINAAFIEKMKARLNDPSIEELIELRIHGFDK